MLNFHIEKNIYYHDTDCGGVVYYANYLKYLEEARTEYFKDRGFDLKSLVQKGLLFVVSHLAIYYKTPTRYQDKIKVSAEIKRIKIASIEFFQRVKVGDRVSAQANVTLVCVGNNFKPKSIPPEIKNALLR